MTTHIGIIYQYHNQAWEVLSLLVSFGSVVALIFNPTAAKFNMLGVILVRFHDSVRCERLSSFFLVLACIFLEQLPQLIHLLTCV